MPESCISKVQFDITSLYGEGREVRDGSKGGRQSMCRAIVSAVDSKGDLAYVEVDAAANIVLVRELDPVGLELVVVGLNPGTSIPVPMHVLPQL